MTITATLCVGLQSRLLSEILVIQAANSLCMGLLLPLGEMSEACLEGIALRAGTASLFTYISLAEGSMPLHLLESPWQPAAGRRQLCLYSGRSCTCLETEG